MDLKGKYKFSGRADDRRCWGRRKQGREAEVKTDVIYLL